MRATGIVRKVDDLGRVVLPVELRRTLDIGVGDAIEIYLDDDRVVLKKFESCCTFCCGSEGLIDYCGKNICIDCVQKLKEM